MPLTVPLRQLVQEAIARGTIVPSPSVIDKKRGRGVQMCHLRKLKDSMPHLTPRQGELLERLIIGQQNKEIAVTMGVSESTVKIYVSRLLEKCGARTRLDLVTFALQQRHGP